MLSQGESSLNEERGKRVEKEKEGGLRGREKEGERRSDLGKEGGDTEEKVGRREKEESCRHRG